MKKQFFVFPALIFIAFLIFSCSKDENNSAIGTEVQSIETLNRSGSVNSVTDIESWFEQYLIDRIGEENTIVGLELLDIEWDNPIQWNENTYVFPMHHFVSNFLYGYTRLFVHLEANSNPIVSFYTVYPDNQDQIEFSADDIINFNGMLVVFDIVEGYKERLQYKNGELIKIYHGGDLILSRCGGCFPDWWAPREVGEGTVGGSWDWDIDNGGCCCGAHCGGSNCGPCNGSGDASEIDIDVIIINIPGNSGALIHKNGSNTTKGGGGGGPVNNPPNGNPKNPVDEAGLDEIEFQQLVNDVCHYLQLNNITDKDCESIALIVNANCRQEDGDLLEDCIQNALHDEEVEEDDECILAVSEFEAIYEITLSKIEKMALHNGVSSCGGVGFEDEAISILGEINNWPNPIFYDLIWKYITRKYNQRNSPYNQANDCEKALMLEHPSCAAQLGFNWISVNLITKYTMGENSQNGCSDAFRHAFFNAMNAALCGNDVAKEFGDAHECETDSQKAKQMDLHNNEVGYDLIESNPDMLALLNSGVAQFHQQGIHELVEKLCYSLSQGEMLIFSDPSGTDPDNDPSNTLNISNTCSCVN